MPVKVRFLLETKVMDIAGIRRWLRQDGKVLPNDPSTLAILPLFLANWNQTYGFLRQDAFLEHLAMYVEQTELLRGIRDLGDRILHDYPPHIYLYVGLGRSPAPLMAYFQSIRVRCLSIPLSNFRPRNVEWSVTDELLVGPFGAPNARLTALQQLTLFLHFRRFIPARPVRPRILLIDYCQSGGSLLAGLEQLQQFLDFDGYGDIAVHALAICRDSDEPRVSWVGRALGTIRSRLRHPVDWWSYSETRRRLAARWHVMAIAAFGVAHTRRQDLVMAALSGQRFDALAEFGSFAILSGHAALVRYTGIPGVTAGYTALQEELRNAR